MSLILVSKFDLKGKHMIRAVFVLTMAAIVAPPATAGIPTVQAQPAAKPDKPQDKIVCRFVNSTGSRLSREKECKTRAQWDHEAEDAQDDLARQTSRGTGDPLNGPH
jgi:hypothetical protein